MLQSKQIKTKYHINRQSDANKRNGDKTWTKIRLLK